MFFKVSNTSLSVSSIFLSFCNSDACLDWTTTKTLPVALMVSLVLQSGVALESTIANLMGCLKSCGFSW